MRPFVKLPFVVASELVELREAQQLAAGDIMKTEPVDEPHPHAADERPDAAIVVVVRQVEQVDGVIGAPIGVAGLDHRIEVGDGPGLVDADAPHEAKRGARAVHVEEVHQEGEDVGVDVAAPVEREGRDLGDEVLGVAEPALPVGEAVGARVRGIGLRRRPEQVEDAAADLLRPAQVVGGLVELAHHFQDAPVADIGAIPEDLIVKHVVAAAEKIGPVARLGDFEQAVVVRILRAQPVHDGLQPVGVAVEERKVAAFERVVVERDHHPEAAVDGSDAPDPGIIRYAVVDADIGRDLPVGRGGVEQRLERGDLGRDDVLILQV